MSPFPRRQFLASLFSLAMVPFTRMLGRKAGTSKVEADPNPEEFWAFPYVWTIGMTFCSAKRVVMQDDRWTVDPEPLHLRRGDGVHVDLGDVVLVRGDTIIRGIPQKEFEMTDHSSAFARLMMKPCRPMAFRSDV